MATQTHYRSLMGPSPGFYKLMAGLIAVIMLGMGAAYYMEHNGHWVTGMTNQIVWGMPHVFAIFLIVAASGALNVASISSVFGRKMYDPLARLSALLAIALLIGGLMVLLLDLGRPDRLIIAMTYYNFKSIFAWNIILYSGFVGIVAVYIWTMMEHKMHVFKKAAGTAAFIWRLMLTTGTGSIFGFLVARQGYDAAIMAPMFIIMSFSFGLAIYILTLMASFNWTDRPLGDAVLLRLKSLLGVFVAAVLYFVIVQHVTNLYATEHHAVERFILVDGGIYTFLFWAGTILVGGLLPLAVVYHPTLGKSRQWIGIACAMVIAGGMATIYVIVIGGQAFPLPIFPDKEIIESSFFDGVVGSYTPSLPEILLGIGGVAVSAAVVAVAAKVLPFLPESLSDEVVDASVS
ncbi:MAG TPA: molybdopterin oxidoreductase [Chromatiaceae bacterium]|jgi:molybdopterin-containing oxidoreductase family membrane subunit|nr:molybdopterin oxidoreductase [Chromatiaceae bacterium]HIB84869.1 molybdopterin oxidoreductase [Chromatiaceae bacterium]HIN81348.1 molybdopterin oxidoreductase [Chromatiales bacterium]HIO13646.1 molybdopterin oxidoreductase [Chromatiales bacterium]HIO54665.1 molybdopterin oxidoreductase [Chromatiales bacterium]